MLAISSAVVLVADEQNRPGYLGFHFTAHRDGDESRITSLVVRHVAPGGPANEANLRPGDRIVAIADRPVHFNDDLDVLLALAEAQPGRRMRMTILREGVRMRLDVLPTKVSDQQYLQWKANIDRLRAARNSAASNPHGHDPQQPRP